ncbi:MAG TPA: dihydrolipoyl dehydrogenase [Abditibacteriaceae bacterium]|jgi:dihydrolipoamide dehydrogenase
MSNENSAQLVVIGGGPGGYAAAFLAADLGMKVTLIDSEPNPGGVCLYRGCIPSKALLHAAKVLTEAHEAEAFGVSFGKPNLDINKLRSWKEGVVAQMTGGLGVLSKQRKINYIEGRATFVDNKTLNVEKLDGSAQNLTFENAILATGSLPATVPAFNIGSDRIWNSTSALELRNVPQNLLVVGGGYIGLELGTVYNALGSQVSVVEMTNGLLPGADRDLVDILAKRVKAMFHSVMLETKVVSMTEEENGIRVVFEGDNVQEKEQLFENVLVSVGRVPNSKNIGLENTDIQVDKRGFVQIDAQRRTTVPNIFAIGDIAGDPMLAHKASHEGRLAVEVIAGHAAAWEPKAIPAVVFTDPEIAWAGITENEAAKQGIAVEVARFPWAASGRATTLGRNDGVTKLLLEPQTQRVLGVGICGQGAGELIAEGVLAVEMAAVADDVKFSIHPHPTLSETMMESAEAFFGQATHIYRPKRK